MFCVILQLPCEIYVIGANLRARSYNFHIRLAYLLHRMLFQLTSVVLHPATHRRCMMTNSTTISPADDTPKAVKVSVPLPPSVHDALRQEAAQKRRELTEHIQRILAEHVIAEKTVEYAEAHRLQLTWSVIDRAVEKAKEICRTGGFTSAITLHAIQACTKDAQWASDYRELVQDDIFKNGNPRKGDINREIGFRIRAGIGGKTVINPDGKVAVAKVLGEIIQSYTPMESFDADAVAPKPRLRAA